MIILGGNCDGFVGKIQNCSLTINKTWEITQDTTIEDVIINCHVGVGLTCLNVSTDVQLIMKGSRLDCYSNGRGINLEPRSNLTVEGGSLTNCFLPSRAKEGRRTWMNGGAVQSLEANTIIMNSVLLKNNSAYDGGAIYLVKHSTLILKDSVIDKNTGFWVGGEFT